MDYKNTKFTYINSPQVTFNGFTSIMRNVYLTSSIGIALLTFSRNFRQDRILVRLIALTILLYSILYGVKAARDFYIYLNFLDSQKDLPSFLREKVKRWYIWIIFTNIYVLIIAFLILFIFSKKILN